ncbi:hypothetical protein KUV50_15435 [Membranicola marinus]|uniref:Uncharacterized protein n=1 Tax=Membranihabitans marinus TaxID=1227546 RepID=A0A953HP12_9BACT|nr:hypothetical protein [Membranihabitans marinus]MBY5959544.1 hypothetical protein [Membranihabitans marinus]
MKVERQKDEIVVRFSAGKNASKIQSILDYLRYEELTSKSKATQKDLDLLLKETKRGRFDKIIIEMGLDEKDYR